MNELILALKRAPLQAKKFGSTFFGGVILVALVHVCFVSLATFVLYDLQILYNGFAFGEWSVTGRCLLMFTYLLVPLALAVRSITSRSE